MLHEDDEDEATHLGDGSTPGWVSPHGEYASNLKQILNKAKLYNGQLWC